MSSDPSSGSREPEVNKPRTPTSQPLQPMGAGVGGDDSRDGYVFYWYDAGADPLDEHMADDFPFHHEEDWTQEEAESLAMAVKNYFKIGWHDHCEVGFVSQTDNLAEFVRLRAMFADAQGSLDTDSASSLSEFERNLCIWAKKFTKHVRRPALPGSSPSLRETELPEASARSLDSAEPIDARVGWLDGSEPVGPCEEFILTYCSASDDPPGTPIYSASDLTQTETGWLAEAMQMEFLKDGNEDGEAETAFFDTCTAKDNPATYIHLRVRWEDINDGLEGTGAAYETLDRHTMDMHVEAKLFVEQIRQIRTPKIQNWFLTCDTGRGPYVFGYITGLDDDEIETLRGVLGKFFYEAGMIFDVFSESTAVQDRPRYLELCQEWDSAQTMLRSDVEPEEDTRESDIRFLWEHSQGVIKDILRLRDGAPVASPHHVSEFVRSEGKGLDDDEMAASSVSSAPSEEDDQPAPASGIPDSDDAIKAEIPDGICSLRPATQKAEEKADEKTAKDSDAVQTGRFEVWDQDSNKTLMFDATNTEHWGPVHGGEGQGSLLDAEPFEISVDDVLYRHESEHWTRVSWKTHSEGFQLPTEACRLSDAEAVDWLVRNGYEAPPELAHLAADLFFTPGKKDEASLGREESAATGAYSDLITPDEVDRPLSDSVKRTHKVPGDGQPTQQPDPFVPTFLQTKILEALKGKGLTKDALAGACNVDPRRLYKAGGLKKLREMGLVTNKRGVGFYRPDASPPNAVHPESSRDRD